MQMIDRESFDKLFDVLKAQGFEVVGPTVRDGAVVYDRLESVCELPVGWTDRQAPGTYRLIRQDNAGREDPIESRNRLRLHRGAPGHLLSPI